MHVSENNAKAEDEGQSPKVRSNGHLVYDHLVYSTEGHSRSFIHGITCQPIPQILVQLA